MPNTYVPRDVNNAIRAIMAEVSRDYEPSKPRKDVKGKRSPLRRLLLARREDRRRIGELERLVENVTADIARLKSLGNAYE